MQRVANAMGAASINMVAFHDALEAMPDHSNHDIIACVRCRDTGLLDCDNGRTQIECHHCNAYFFRNRRNRREERLGQFLAGPQEGAPPDQRMVSHEQHWDYAANAMIETVTYASGRVDVVRVHAHELQRDPNLGRQIQRNMVELAFAVPPHHNDQRDRSDRRERAEGLLLRHLSEDQKKQYALNKSFNVVGGISGKVYTINYEATSNVRCEGLKYCAVLTNGEPLPDQLLAQMLTLRHREDCFLRIAIPSRPGGGYGRAGMVRFHDDPFDEDNYNVGWLGIDWHLVSGSLFCAGSAILVIWSMSNTYDWLVRLAAKL